MYLFSTIRPRQGSNLPTDHYGPTSKREVRKYAHSTILERAVTLLRLSRKPQDLRSMCVYHIMCVFRVSIRKKHRSFRYIFGELTL
jgi:hypothetical protein